MKIAIFLDGVMGSQSDSKTRKSPYAQGKGRVVKDESGRQVWKGTIRTLKLSMMKTGIFFMSEAQRRLMKLREAGTDDASNDLDEDLEFIDDSGGFDPYDSPKKYMNILN